jgi:integrase
LCLFGVNFDTFAKMRTQCGHGDDAFPMFIVPLYVSRDVCIRAGSGIWVDRKGRGEMELLYITNDERNKLLEADLSDNIELETQRDIFVFQCLTGCRVSDLYKMTYKSIIDNTIEYIPRKTKEERAITVRVPLNDTAKQLIDKYYEVASSHMAKRSFIGNIHKKVNDPNLVGALSGHKEGSKAVARYRTIDDDMKKELINMLE